MVGGKRHAARTCVVNLYRAACRVVSFWGRSAPAGESCCPKLCTIDFMVKLRSDLLLYISAPGQT